MKDSKILITGPRGFIGSALMKHLKAQGVDEDVRDIEKLRPYFKDADFVIHTAAKIKKVGDHYYWDVNVVGTRNVAKLCMENNCKMIHFGTVVTDHTYGQTKLVSEMLVEQLCKLGLKAVIIRLSPVKDLKKLVADIEHIIKHHDFEKFVRILKS